MILKGKTITPKAKLLIEEVENLEILNLFERSLNLVTPDDRVLSVVDSSIGPGPFAIEIEPLGEDYRERVDFKWLFGGFPTVQTADGGFIISGNYIDCTKCLTWDPTPEWNAISKGSLDTSLPVIENIALEIAMQESLVTPFLKGRQTAPYHARALDAWRSLIAGNQSGDQSILRVGIEGLSGLGPGLTPAGDDFLMGFIYSIWASRSEGKMVIFINQIIEIADNRTTTLCKAWLRAAAAGEAADSWHRLVKAIIGNDDVKLKLAAAEMLDHGNSSGADALAGFLTGVKSLNQYQEPLADYGGYHS